MCASHGLLIPGRMSCFLCAYMYVQKKTEADYDKRLKMQGFIIVLYFLEELGKGKRVEFIT